MKKKGSSHEFGAAHALDLFFLLSEQSFFSKKIVDDALPILSIFQKTTITRKSQQGCLTLKIFILICLPKNPSKLIYAFK